MAQIRRVFKEKLAARIFGNRRDRLPARKIRARLNEIALVRLKKELNPHFAVRKQNTLRGTAKLAGTDIDSISGRPRKSTLIDARRADTSPRVNRRAAGKQRVSESRTTVVLKWAEECVRVRDVRCD